jgi:hypothetical protein
MKDRSKKVIKAIRLYQERGAVGDFDPENFEQNGVGVEWSDHVAGTIIYPNVGSIFLGLPNGFNRMGNRLEGSEQFKLHIFPTFTELEKIWKYNTWNVPCWKYLNEHKHTLVRGLSPRLNAPFLHIILEDCIDKIDCLEITNQDVEEMD